VTIRLFVDLNGWSWDPMRSVDDAERAMLWIASGEWDQAQVSAWLLPGGTVTACVAHLQGNCSVCQQLRAADSS
jgi:hypothetical protein